MGRPVVHFEIMGGEGETLRAFYRSLFDWKIDVQPQFDYGLVDPESSGIGGGIGPSGEGGGGVTVYVEVPDINATLAQIESSGGKVLMPREELGMVTLAVFTDPAGNRLGLVESRPEA